MYLWRGSTFVFLFSSDINSRENAAGTPNFRVLFLCGRSFWKKLYLLRCHDFGLLRLCLKKLNWVFNSYIFHQYKELGRRINWAKQKQNIDLFINLHYEIVRNFFFTDNFHVIILLRNIHIHSLDTDDEYYVYFECLRSHSSYILI